MLLNKDPHHPNVTVSITFHDDYEKKEKNFGYLMLWR